MAERILGKDQAQDRNLVGAPEHAALLQLVDGPASNSGGSRFESEERHHVEGRIA